MRCETLFSLSDFRDKTLTDARNRRDVLTLLPAVAERLSQRRNVLVEVVLLDDCVRPDPLRQFIRRFTGSSRNGPNS